MASPLDPEWENWREEAIWRAHVESTLREIQDDLLKLDTKFDQYTHKYQFEPVRNVAYGLVGALALILVGALGTLLFTGGVG